MNDEVYRGAASAHNNSLCHWKYIKKKKVNGKWRYYYKPEYEYKIYDKPEVSSLKDKRYFVTNVDRDINTGDKHIRRSMHVNSLFGSKEREVLPSSNSEKGKTIVDTRYYGKIDRLGIAIRDITSDVIDEGKKWVDKYIIGEPGKIVPYKRK